MPEAFEKDQVESVAGSLRLIACPSLALEHGRIDRYVPEGATVAGHLRAIGWQPDPLHARVFIDGVMIEKARWEEAMPAAGQALTIRVIPMGGGGGDGGGKMALRIVAMIAVVAASIFLPALAPAAWGLTTAAGGLTGLGLLASATISIVGSLAISALIPPARPRVADLSSPGLDNNSSSPTLSLTGSSNQLAPYAPVPRVYGRHLIYPPLAARTYTEVVGNDQYLRLLFCCGYGPLTLADLKIGQTPINQFQGVELEIRYGFPDDAPLTLFPSDVYEDNSSILLGSAAGWQQRTSQAHAKELSVDITFPGGLVQFLTTGGTAAYAVTVGVEYRLVGAVGWTSADTQPLVSASAQTSFSGANNDLVFTAVRGGASGNALLVRVVAGSALSVTAGAQWDADGNQTFPPDYIQIEIVDGVTTSAAVKAAIEANSAAAALITVAHAGGNTGAGAIALSGGAAVSYQLAGGRDLIPAFQCSNNVQTQARYSLRWTVPAEGQYEVRLRKVTADANSTYIHDQVYWTTLRTIQPGAPVTKTGLCLVAMRIKATDQLNGTVDQFNCIAQSILPDWTGTAWVSRPTSNPASIYRDILQGSANKRPKADSRLDLATIQDFHERCTAQGFAFNAVIDFRTTVKQLRQDVLAVGRGAFGLRDMKYSVIQDLLQASPVDVITPRTSSGFRWTKRFLDPIHAFKVRFVDEVNNWQQGERIVYADGYDATNATIFEEVDAGVGVTNSEQAWKLKRRELADAYLRADDYVMEMDFANLTFTRGDRIQFQHDVILAGLLSARIKAVTVNGGGDATGITFDDALTMADGTNYGARIKKADGSQLVQQITTVAGEVSSVTFTTPIPVATVPAAGDLVIFGELGRESLDCIVKAIEPGADYAATVHLLDYAPAIHDADSGPVPPYDSHVTTLAQDRRLVAMPVLDRIQSDETVLLRDTDGSYQSRLLLTLSFTSGFRLPVSHVEAQYRLHASSGAWTQLFAPVSGLSTTVSISPVQDGASYDVRVRGVSEIGATSDWLTIENETVIGKTTPPPDVPLFLRDGDRLVWAYPAPPLDMGGFEIRRHFGTRVNWADAQPIHSGLLSGTSWPLPGDLGTMTYLIKAIDTAGNPSTGVNWTTVNLGDLLVENLLFTEDKKAASFPGTHNGVLNAGNLEANTSGTFWSGNDAAAFWSGSDANLFWTSQYLALDYITTMTPDADKVPATLLLDMDVSAESYAIDYRINGSALFWSGTDGSLFWSGNDAASFWTAPGADDWLPWLGRLDEATRQEYTWRLRTAPGPVKGVISKYQLKVDVPDIEESYQDVVIAAGTGTRLPITKSYRGIKNVEMNLVNTGGTALTSLIEDYGTGGPPLTGGPLVTARDTARVAVAGKISGKIQGW